MEKSWESVRRAQELLKVKEVTEDDLSEVRRLRERVKSRIHESESILDLTSRFHLTLRQVGGAGRRVLNADTFI